jgi:branched-chain amino acid transport system ATP-binding protein
MRASRLFRAGSVLINVSQLSVYFGKVCAVDHASIDLFPGEIQGIVGLNGAGKSSLANAIAGRVIPKYGTVSLDDSVITHHAPHQRPQIGLVPEGRILAPSLSVVETLQLGAGRVAGSDFKARLDNVFAIFPELVPRMTQAAGSLSGGEASLLSIARALIKQPDYLILDEPTLGLSPAATVRVFGIMSKLRERGMSILLIEQNLEQVIQLTDRISVMRYGRVTPIEAGADDQTLSTIQNLLFSKPRSEHA